MSDSRKPPFPNKKPVRPVHQTAGNKPADGEPRYGRPANAAPAGDKPAGEKQAFGRPAGDKPFRPRPAGGKPAYGRPNFARPANAAPGGDKPEGEKPAFGRPSGARPASGRPFQPRPAGGKPAYGRPNYVRPTNAAPGSDTPAGEKPAFGRPAGARPASGRPFQPRPAGGKPAYGRPNFSRPANAAPGSEKPEGEKPAFGRPAGARPSGDKPFRPRPAGGKPAYGRPNFARPANAAPSGDEPTGENRTFSGPAGERPSSGRPFQPRPAGGKPAYRRPDGAKPTFRPAGGPRRPAISRDQRPAFKASPAPATTMSLGARRLALNILQDVHRDGAFASLALDKRLKDSGLAALDKRLTANIVYGTLENRIRIDYALDSLLTQKDADPLIRDILRLSAYQILFLDKVPDSAAVNEGVKLCKEAGMEPLSGFVNGVLRNLIRQRDEIAWPKREDGEARYISILHSVPEWLVERLIGAYGVEMAEAICSHRVSQHDTPIRPNRMKLTDEAFEQLLERKVWKAEKAQVPHVWRIGNALDIGSDADYRKGLFSIQGESSVLAAEAVGVKRGMQVLDACAAPGGKAVLMAEIMDGTGRVHAWDLHEHRVALIQAAAKRLQLENLRPMVRDAAAQRDELIDTFDAVLLDAPCSGLGVMLEKPDVKYRQSAESVDALVQTQKKLLDVLSQYVKKGGVLVYATCSILPEENSQQIEAFLTSHNDFALSPLPASIPEKFRALYGENGLQLFAHRDGLEGFFIARLVRKGN